MTATVHLPPGVHPTDGMLTVQATLHGLKAQWADCVLDDNCPTDVRVVVRGVELPDPRPAPVGWTSLG